MTKWLRVAVVVIGLAGCGQTIEPGEGNADPGPAPGDVQVVVTPGDNPALNQLQSSLQADAQLDADALLARHRLNFETSLGYDPSQAQGLTLLQNSKLALKPAELQLLANNGFVIVGEQAFPSFFYSYLTVYSEDLPVFVSADSILDALHRSYDDILLHLERGLLIPTLEELLRSMTDTLSSSTLDSATAADLGLYLTVAQSLLRDRQVTAPAGVEMAAVGELVDLAKRAEASKWIELFGSPRNFDFSQFKPRGHYEQDPQLQRYFRAMMWLGRVDFRFLETLPTGEQVFRRRHFNAALGLRELMDANSRSHWQGIDEVVTAFVGEHDYMTVPQLDSLLADLGATGLADLRAVSEQELAEAVQAGGYGQQRIASHIIRKPPSAAGTLPLNVSFAFFGQRYTVDSHVFSNVVYDRAGGGKVRRWLPDPLDAAFAALGNDQALSLLEPELRTHAYAGDLAKMRTLVQAHPREYFDSSLYTLWLSALTKLSPSAHVGPAATDLPSVAKTEAWGRRLLNTQLGSWSQLRHDTLLYAKQSYTVGSICEFPDAYVDPYPEFFEKIGHFARRGSGLVSALNFPSSGSGLRNGIVGYFEELAQVADTLREMAVAQRTGMPHSAAHLAFINEVVDSRSGGSGPPSVEGWYATLFYRPLKALEYDPVIADVHTDPGGLERLPSVLHVATGKPRLMVTTVPTCMGPRLYVGPVFSYHELRKGGLTRMTDSGWQTEIRTAPPADVAWMAPLIAR